MLSFLQFPDEIIQHLLYYLSAEDNLSSVQLVSKRLHRLASENLLWRHHCQNAWKYWHPDHDYEQKLEALPSEVDWKHLFILRKRRNARISNLLDGILATRVGRVRKFEQICSLGYDAKDFLLEQCRVDESRDDVLARR
jgi:F-box protein 21